MDSSIAICILYIRIGLALYKQTNDINFIWEYSFVKSSSFHLIWDDIHINFMINQYADNLLTWTDNCMMQQGPSIDVSKCIKFDRFFS